MRLLCGRVGDFLMAINGVDVTRMSEEEVRRVIATTPLGSVRLVILPQQIANLCRQSTGIQCWGVFKYYLYLNIKLGKKYLS